MRWVVGIDLRGFSRGAINMASWLRRAGAGAEGVVGVHVVETPGWLTEAGVEPAPVSELVEISAQTMSTLVEEAGAAPDFEQLDNMEPLDAPERSLAAACEAHGADGIVIGRRKPREAGALVHLGGVARRLLRSLPAPVLVAPPDLDRDAIGTGPVIVATDLSPASEAACELARQLADSLSRELVVAHVVADVVRRSPYLLALGVDNEGLQARVRKAGQNRLDAWADRRNLAGARTIVDNGRPVHRLCVHVVREDAALLVCGSRGLPVGARLFASSVGSHLAAEATCGVLVVPAAA